MIGALPLGCGQTRWCSALAVCSVNSPDHFDTTTVATLLPMVLQVAMANDLKRWTPNSSARPSTGSTPIAVTVAANTKKLPPDTAAAPLR